MIIVSWNCRGLGSSSKVEAIKNMIKSKKLDIMMIQETKMVEDGVMALSQYTGKIIKGKP